jgi:hypothetical protein
MKTWKIFKSYGEIQEVHLILPKDLLYPFKCPSNA